MALNSEGEWEGSFDTLLAAFDVTNISPTLSSSEVYTVFAPTDEAFAANALTLETLQAQSLNMDILTEVLLYHTVPGEYSIAQISEENFLLATQGDQITIQTTAEGMFLDGITTLNPEDYYAGNGIIHVVDSVLVPPAR